MLVASLMGRSVDHTTDATALKKDLSQMVGVGSVDQYYEAGDVVLPGSQSIEVTMSPDATTEEALAVIDAAYDEFATTFQRESADLVVHRVGTEILVHTRQPRAEISDVLAVARFALDAPRTGERIRADIVAHDEDLRRPRQRAPAAPSRRPAPSGSSSGPTSCTPTWTSTASPTSPFEQPPNPPGRSWPP